MEIIKTKLRDKKILKYLLLNKKNVAAMPISGEVTIMPTFPSSGTRNINVIAPNAEPIKL